MTTASHRLVVTSQGHRYPNHDVIPLGYGTDHADDDVAGRYRVDVDNLHKWREIEGTAITSSSTPEFEVVEPRGHLDG